MRTYQFFSLAAVLATDGCEKAIYSSRLVYMHCLIARCRDANSYLVQQVVRFVLLGALVLNCQVACAQNESASATNTSPALATLGARDTLAAIQQVLKAAAGAESSCWLVVPHSLHWPQLALL